MNHRNRSLSTPSGLAGALVLALVGSASLSAGCAESGRPQQASAPTQRQAAPGTEYGAAMGQPSSSPSAPMTGPAGTPTPGTTEYPETLPAPATPMPSSEYAPPSATSPNAMPTPSYGAAGREAGRETGPMGGMGSPSGMAGTSPTGPSAGAGGPMDVSGYDDAQLAAIVQAINMGEMLAAQLAENRAASPDVRRFARDMETQHRDMQSRANAVFSRSLMTPSENPVSARLKSEMQSELSSLQSMRGKDFDRAYIEAEVREHNAVLELVDRMIADARSPELKAELENMRPKEEAHLRKVETMQQSPLLPKGTTNKQRGPNPH
jgi:putative membrane protein